MSQWLLQWCRTNGEVIRQWKMVGTAHVLHGLVWSYTEWKNGGNFPSHTRLGLADVASRQTKMAGIGHVLLGLVWLAGSVGSLEDSFPRTPIINTRHHTPDISLTCDDLCFFLDCPFTWLPYFSSQSTCYTFQKSLKSRYLDLHLLKNFSDLEKMKI